ncbi:LysR family transcriptional regulator [Pseudomonas sp.]|uniref:LysR family transcriptional regulator n=1 Tax=Pseudomonas sp. TaxID=306 RepID=UPI003CC64383
MKSPDIDAIRAFLLVAQLKSFTRVADTMGTTQAAISLKIKRLEEAVGRALLDRTPRRVTLSAHGQAFHANAQRLLDSYNDAMGSFNTPKRTLRIGVSHHIVGADLSYWLQRLMAADPQVVLAFSLGTSRELLDGYEQGKLDVALVLRHDNRRQDGEVIGAERFTWMAAPALQVAPEAPLPLAIQPAPCGMRSMVLSALQAHDRSWLETFMGSGILAIGAAVAAGIGIGAMVGRMAPAGCVDVTTRFGLPELSIREVVLYTAHRDAQVRHLIDTLVAAMSERG